MDYMTLSYILILIFKNFNLLQHKIFVYQVIIYLYKLFLLKLILKLKFVLKS